MQLNHAMYISLSLVISLSSWSIYHHIIAITDPWETKLSSFAFMFQHLCCMYKFSRMYIHLFSKDCSRYFLISSHRFEVRKRAEQGKLLNSVGMISSFFFFFSSQFIHSLTSYITFVRKRWIMYNIVVNCYHVLTPEVVMSDLDVSLLHDPSQRILTNKLVVRYWLRVPVTSGRYHYSVVVINAYDVIWSHLKPRKISSVWCTVL